MNKTQTSLACLYAAVVESRVMLQAVCPTIAATVAISSDCVYVIVDHCSEEAVTSTVSQCVQLLLKLFRSCSNSFCNDCS